MRQKAILAALALALFVPVLISSALYSPRGLARDAGTGILRIQEVKKIALTFDDGPNPPYTTQIVQILGEKEASATFFMVGVKAVSNTETIQEVIAGGHQIGNHGWSHRRLDLELEPSIQQELNSVNEFIMPFTHYELRSFRPPYLATSPLLEDIVERKGDTMVMWTVDSEDWMGTSSATIANTVITRAFPGAIVVMHDGWYNRANTVEALPTIIDTLSAQGYTFVTVDQLAQ